MSEIKDLFIIYITPIRRCTADVDLIVPIRRCTADVGLIVPIRRCTADVGLIVPIRRCTADVGLVVPIRRCTADVHTVYIGGLDYHTSEDALRAHVEVLSRPNFNFDQLNRPSRHTQLYLIRFIVYIAMTESRRIDTHNYHKYKYKILVNP